jgi:hypothetical protein
MRFQRCETLRSDKVPYFCACVSYDFPSNSLNFLKIKAKVVCVKYAFSLKRERNFFLHILFLKIILLIRYKV